MQDEVQKWMESLGFEYDKVADRWIAPQDSPWKLYAIDYAQATFFYQATQREVVEARRDEYLSAEEAWFNDNSDYFDNRQKQLEDQLYHLTGEEYGK